jgi:hypothetical protein
MQNNKQLTELEKQRKGRLVFIAMLIFFIVPLIVVMMMYKFNWMPSGASVGELVRPARLLNISRELKNNQGIALPSQFWMERWSIVYIAGECQKPCLDKLHDMRQLHVSLYKDMPRVQRVLITKTLDTLSIKRDYPDLIVINQPVDYISGFSQQFQMHNENVFSSNRLYVVAPLGHLMMSYDSKLSLAAVRKDLIRLLKFSWTG